MSCAITPKGMTYVATWLISLHIVVVNIPPFLSWPLWQHMSGYCWEQDVSFGHCTELESWVLNALHNIMCCWWSYIPNTRIPVLSWFIWDLQPPTEVENISCGPNSLSLNTKVNKSVWTQSEVPLQASSSFIVTVLLHFAAHLQWFMCVSGSGYDITFELYF